MNKELYIAEMLLPAGAAVPLHHHAEPEFFYVLDGVCEFGTIENGSEKWAVSKAGDSILIPIGVTHGLRNESEADSRLLVVTTHGQELFFQEAGTPADPKKPPCAASGEELERVFGVAARYGAHTVMPHASFAAQTHEATPTPKLVPRCYWRLERIS